MPIDTTEQQSNVPDQKDSSHEETLANSWSSAFDKASDDGSLTEADINKALIDDAYVGGKTFTRDERIALNQMKDNFDDVARLDRDAFEPEISKSDINLFSDLYRNTARDIAFYERGVNFLAQNKSRLDTNKNGVLTLKEIQDARVNPAFSTGDMQVIDYLRDRYSNKLRYSHAVTDLSVTEATVPDADYKSGAMKEMIHRNQALAFELETHDSWSSLSWVGPAIGGLAGAYFTRSGLFTTAALSVGGAVLGKLVFSPMAHWDGQLSRYKQEERIQRLMTTVGNLNY